MQRRYELELVSHGDRFGGGEYWIIYDNVDNKYRGRYDDVNTAIEDCDFFNESWEDQD